jgi:crossover junction endodeoxyribonuclease RusA
MVGGVQIELPWPPASLSGHHNAHWRKLQPVKKLWRTYAETATLASGARVSETGDIRISVTFYPPDRRGDRTNYPNRCKPIFDGIADALKVNDRRFLPTYHFGEPVKNPRVVITIGVVE